jgi:uncharacterized protein YukE
MEVEYIMKENSIKQVWELLPVLQEKEKQFASAKALFQAVLSDLRFEVEALSDMKSEKYFNSLINVPRGKADDAMTPDEATVFVKDMIEWHTEQVQQLTQQKNEKKQQILALVEEIRELRIKTQL